MKFSGHETFAIREGWLHKGLKLLIEDPELLYDEYVADWLGVGKNMSRSIRHWLVVTGLAERVTGNGRQSPLVETELGQLIYERDLYFNESGTWWALHLNLVAPKTQVYTWQWFFNHFNLHRFDRSVCLESLRRHVLMSGVRSPRTSTLERDLACMLASYGRVIPVEHDDPEEARECPFVELGLMNHFRMSGYYQLHQGAKDVPPHLFGYALAQAFPDLTEGEGTVDIPLLQAARQPGGPGRAFVLTGESLFDLTSQVEATLGSREIQIAGLAGSRMIRVTKKKSLDWLRNYYADLERGDRRAA